MASCRLFLANKNIPPCLIIHDFVIHYQFYTIRIPKHRFTPPYSTDTSLRYSEGERPVRCLNERLKWYSPAYPHAVAISAIFR